MQDELKLRLTELGLTDDQITKLEGEGAKDEAGLATLNADEIKSITDCGLVIAKQVYGAFKPAPPPVDPTGIP